MEKKEKKRAGTRWAAILAVLMLSVCGGTAVYASGKGSIEEAKEALPDVSSDSGEYETDQVQYEKMDGQGIVTEDAYAKLAAYRTEDIFEQSVAQFNASLAPSSEAFIELLDAYAAVTGTIAPGDDNYDFFTVTCAASLNELHSEIFHETPTFFITLSRQERPGGKFDTGETWYLFSMSANVNLCYSIKDLEAITVAERDRILRAFREELQAYVDSLSEQEMTEAGMKRLLLDKGSEIAERLATENMQLSCEIGYFEICSGEDV